MPSALYLSALTDTLSGRIAFVDQFKVLLVRESYRVDAKGHTHLLDVVGDEVAGPGYLSGGAFVPLEILKDAPNKRVDVLLGGAVWSPATITAAGAVYYQAKGGELVAFIDFNSSVIAVNGEFSLMPSVLRIQT